MRFLLENPGMEHFRRLYAMTPLVPGAHNADSAARWGDVYERAFHEIEGDWKAMISDHGA